ncbi:MAG: hypothetical protein JJ975_03580 [Bacteroidia bacterium]|nr:hypothetical protein [Bacteroidia bacterium]
MKAASIKEIKDELEFCSTSEIRALCLHLARFKKENKELLTYLLFKSSNEAGFIDSIKEEMAESFGSINTSSPYYIKKSARKILKDVKKYIRYSKKKETEIELLLHYCALLREVTPDLDRHVALRNLFRRQIDYVRKTMKSVHEDLQYDFNKELSKLV